MNARVTPGYISKGENMIKSKQMLAIGVIAAVGLAACGSDSESTTEEPTGTEAAGETTATTEAAGETVDSAISAGGMIRQTAPIGLFERSQVRDPEIVDGPADPGGE